MDYFLVKKYCGCKACIENSIIENPYEIFEKRFSREDISLPFDFRASALCRYECEKFNSKATCPPNIPDMPFFQRTLNEYDFIHVLGRKYPYNDGHFLKHWRTYSTNEIHALLLKKEKDFFMEGQVYAKAFIGGSCKVCSSENCDPKRCRIPGTGRIPLEATGINIFKLMRSMDLEYEEPPVNYFWRIGAVLF